MNKRKRILLSTIFLVFTVSMLVTVGEVYGQMSDGLKAGAVKVNITPPEDANFKMRGYGGQREGFTGILDSLYVRTIVVDDGENQAAIMVTDLVAISDIMWEKISERIERETGINRENLLLAATHTHSAPDIYQNEGIDEKLEVYIQSVSDKIVQSVNNAQARRVKARIGVAQGHADINVNRVAQTETGGYWLGQNLDGISDETVHVVKFEDLQGRPIAILVNYGVHAVVAGPENLHITADLPGATSRLVEQHYGDGVIVPWTSGAAGDQNPIYAILDDPHDGGIQLYGSPMNAQAKILGEEVIRVAENMERMASNASIRGGQKVVSVPGKERNQYNPTANYTFVDADPLDIRLTMLKVGHVAFGGVSGEVLTRIGKRFKAESPFSESIMITNANGASGYLLDDKAYERPGYEFTSTRAKEGAEDAIVNGLIDLMLAKD